MQELNLTIRHVHLLTGLGLDQISLSVPAEEVLDVVLGKSEAREIFPELHFDLRITTGKGQELLGALGLTADEIVCLQPSYKFQREEPDGK